MITPESIDLPKFLSAWYGPATKEETPLSDACDWLPETLKKWYKLASRWSVPLESITFLLSPEDIKVENGKALFMQDAAGDWCWGFDAEDTNSVFDAEFYEPWEKTRESLPELIVHRAVKEALYGAPVQIHASGVSSGSLPAVLADLDEVGFEAWRWPGPGYRIFMDHELLLEINPSRHTPEWSLKAAAVTVDRLAGLIDIPAVSWRNQTR